MLSGEWYSNDRDRQQRSKDQVHHRRIQPATEQPDNIAEKRETPYAASRWHDPFAKWPKFQSRELETLQPERNPHNRKAQHKAADDIAHRGKEATTDQPYKVSYKIHWLKIPIF